MRYVLNNDPYDVHGSSPYEFELSAEPLTRTFVVGESFDVPWGETLEQDLKETLPTEKKEPAQPL